MGNQGHTPDNEKALIARGPSDYRTINEFHVLKFDCDLAFKIDPLPDQSWAGKFVVMRCTGGVVHYGFTTRSGAEVDASVAATAAGASTKVGGILPDGLQYETKRQIPYKEGGETMYFVRDSSADNAIVYMELVDYDVP